MTSRGTADWAPSPRPASTVSALHTLRELPLDPDFHLFQHYPAMKLGMRESVREYARLLLPLVRDALSRRPRDTDWVVTGPPFFAIPSGANLVAWEVYGLLRHGLSTHISLRAIDVHLLRPSPASLTDYSNSDVDDRIENRRRLHDSDHGPKLDASVFRGRAVLFINDINVTGTQQSFMQEAFDSVQPASVDWTYIIQVDPLLGRSKPELEYSLNHLSLGSFEAFEEVVAREDIDFTARCVQRLFDYSSDDLESLFHRLDDARRKRLYELAVREGIYTREDQVAKLALLREHFAALP